MFARSLDGEFTKWFRELVDSINGIYALEELFMKRWGETKDFLYYITRFGALKIKSDESVTDFTKHFNKMYGKIPTETSANITYVNAFDVDFSLLLRERRSLNLANM